MPQRPLHHEHVSPCRDGERCGGVPQSLRVRPAGAPAACLALVQFRARQLYRLSRVTAWRREEGFAVVAALGQSVEVIEQMRGMGTARMPVAVFGESSIT